MRVRACSHSGPYNGCYHLQPSMAPHSSTLAWEIPWTEEPGGLQSMGSHRVGHDWIDLAAVKGFTIANEAEVDIFLEFPSFFYYTVNVGNLISCSSNFFKYSLCTWNFSVHVLLKPNLKDFELYLADMWNECNCAVVWHYLALPFFEIEMKTDLFQSCGHCWGFQICWHIECSTFTTSGFEITQLEFHYFH